ncbi:putative 4-hydroxy-4-methyl-2-oxoglutarate aldolase [Acinetobacter qingfengensis]|uniref:4-hydroxy-4-methyl-2-oxoglutarate aldolase n=1 Tax=Acinetobacter qingfengensis TaxID=1262585 RepID=A0A1E7RF33_9GAMM|nr:ribonuclease E activity regulator RraA [Acinetobacter qingfengensis]KAA8735619.1 putative 4-hydroxy-4-methyl-2-oxoglutarate aldolase [Acinetobacter qingfengensis]OEY97931.1 ribonuclease activity regulator protein RraA [Acinetobacter qingfengensis]
MCADFVTCDLLDGHSDKNLQVVSPSIDGKSFKNFGARITFGGQVVTVKCFEDNSRVKELLATDGSGKVLVVDGGASIRCALMGDLIAESAVKNHWNGVIIYGCVRDVDAIATLDLGVQALAAIPQKSTRKGVGEIGLTVYFGDVEIAQGDYIYADNNGIIVAKRALI